MVLDICLAIMCMVYLLDDTFPQDHLLCSYVALSDFKRYGFFPGYFPDNYSFPFHFSFFYTNGMHWGKPKVCLHSAPIGILNLFFFLFVFKTQ